MAFRGLVIEAIRLSVFVIFLLAASWQDYKIKQVTVRLFRIAGAAALGIWLIWGLEVTAGVMSSGQNQRLAAELWEFGSPFLLGMMPGLALLCFSKIGMEIGEGDGWFFLICGWYLGVWDTLFLLFGAVFLCGLSGLGYYITGRARGSSTDWARGKTQWPFLPFAAIPGLWIAVVRLKHVWQMMVLLHRFRV